MPNKMFKYSEENNRKIEEAFRDRQDGLDIERLVRPTTTTTSTHAHAHTNARTHAPHSRTHACTHAHVPNRFFHNNKIAKNHQTSPHPGHTCAQVDGTKVRYRISFQHGVNPSAMQSSENIRKTKEYDSLSTTAVPGALRTWLPEHGNGWLQC